jgi:hypothetical protein
MEPASSFTAAPPPPPPVSLEAVKEEKTEMASPPSDKHHRLTAHKRQQKQSREHSETTSSQQKQQTFSGPQFHPRYQNAIAIQSEEAQDFFYVVEKQLGSEGGYESHAFFLCDPATGLLKFVQDTTNLNTVVRRHRMENLTPVESVQAAEKKTTTTPTPTIYRIYFGGTSRQWWPSNVCIEELVQTEFLLNNKHAVRDWNSFIRAKLERIKRDEGTAAAVRWQVAYSRVVPMATQAPTLWEVVTKL